MKYIHTYVESLLNKCDPKSYIEKKKMRIIKKKLALCTVNNVKEKTYLLDDKKSPMTDRRDNLIKLGKKKKKKVMTCK